MRTKALSDSALFQTTYNYYKIALQLLGIIPPETMTLYGELLKEMKQLLEDNYDQLVISNIINLKQQRLITLINVSGEDFFKISINLTPKSKNPSCT